MWLGWTCFSIHTIVPRISLSYPGYPSRTPDILLVPRYSHHRYPDELPALVKEDAYGFGLPPRPPPPRGTLGCEYPGYVGVWISGVRWGVNIRSTRVCISGVRGSAYPGYDGCEYPEYKGMHIQGTREWISGVRECEYQGYECECTRVWISGVRECDYPGYECEYPGYESVNIRGTRVWMKS